MTHETASMFTGVNEGYQGESVAITDPAKAVEIVKAKLAETQAAHGDANHYQVHPGVVIYNEGWGCPKGGEVVAAVTTAGNPETAIQTATALRGALNQSTLSVGTYSGDHGLKTKGFLAEVVGDLKTVGTAWQEAAYTHGNFIRMATLRIFTCP